MSQAVRKVLPIARILNHVARGAVQVAHAHARCDERLGGLVGAAHDVVDTCRLLVRLAPKERARHVRAVVAMTSANVEQHHVAALEYGVVGLVVRVAGVGAKAHDGRKAKALAAVLAVQAEHLVGNFALRHALVDELDGVGHYGVVSGRGRAHELLLGGILVGARGGDGKVAQEELARGAAIHKGHQKAGAHNGIDAEGLVRIDLASDGVGHDVGIGVIGDAGIVILGQLMQRVDQDHGLAITREQRATKTLEHIGIKAGQIVDRPRVVHEQLRAGVLSLERIEHARHALVIDMCHETSFRQGATMVSQAPPHKLR